MKLRIRTLTGTEFLLEHDPDNTIREIVNHLLEINNKNNQFVIYQKDIRLILEGTELNIYDMLPINYNYLFTPIYLIIKKNTNKNYYIEIPLINYGTPIDLDDAYSFWCCSDSESEYYSAEEEFTPSP